MFVLLAGRVTCISEPAEYKTPGSIRTQVNEGVACTGVHRSAQDSSVKHKEEKPIQILRPALSWGDLEGKEVKKEGPSSLLLESKEDAVNSYNEDECKRNALHQNELLSSEHNNKSFPIEDSSDGGASPQVLADCEGRHFI